MTDITMLGTIEHIDPTLIGIETNVRTQVNVDKVLVDSIREFGVLEPVVCRRVDDTVQVRMGQRRVLAAREAGVATIPAYVVEGDESTTQRLVEQFAENEHRANLTAPERAAVFQQLAFEGMPVAQIAKRTGVKKAEVEHGITVAGSEYASKVAARHDVTLDQAAAILEFEGDDVAAQRLIDTAESNPEQFAHELQRQRDNRVRAEAVLSKEAELVEQGFTLLETRPDSYYDKEHVNIAELLTEDGRAVTVNDLTEVSPKFAHVRSFYTGDVEVGIYLTYPKAHGFKKATVSTTGPMSDEHKEERRTLIANNKAWASAETVRRDWLATFLSRKPLPKDAPAFVATGLTAHRMEVSAALSTGNRLAATLLGFDAQGDYWAPSPVDTYAQQPGKAAHVSLAIVLAGMEGATSKDTWRRPTTGAARYLEQLAAWGYALSDVEKIVTSSKAQTSDLGTDAVQAADPKVTEVDQV